MEKKKVLITYPIKKEGLKQLFKSFDVVYNEIDHVSGEALWETINEYDAILAVGVKMDATLMDRARRLQIICSYGAGYDNIDIKAATERGIIVANIPDVVTDATAELTMGIMLSLMRRITECDRQLRSNSDFDWSMNKHLGNVLYGKELGIIGMGRIGKAVAKRATSFGMNISYYNRKRLDPVIEMELGTTYKRFDDLLKSANVLTIHTPLTDETHHLIGERELSLMKETAYLINTSRGAVLDERALVKCLQEGKLAGAALDVYENEPVISPELLQMDNVVLTPHIGTEAIEPRIEMGRECAQSIIDYFSGRKPFHVVNPEVYINR